MNFLKLNFVAAFLLALLTIPSAGKAAQGDTANVPMAPKTEAQWIKDLESKNANTVVAALNEIEEHYGSSTNAIAAIKKLVKDPRDRVRRKAARVLGVLHADVNEDEIKAIGALLKSSDSGEIIDGLKALRTLPSSSQVPEMIPLLTHKQANVVRDACRTLGAIADKSVIPSIEPLLKSSNPDIQRDAQTAIAMLRAKK